MGDTTVSGTLIPICVCEPDFSGQTKGRKYVNTTPSTVRIDAKLLTPIIYTSEIE